MRLFNGEREFTRWALHEARSRGWLAAHLGNVQIVRGKGGTPVAIPDKDAAGFPDLVAVHPLHGVLFSELKMPQRSGRLRDLDEDQVLWLRMLRAAGARVYVWGPGDQDEIADVFDGVRELRTRLFDQETKR